MDHVLYEWIGCMMHAPENRICINNVFPMDNVVFNK